MGLLDMFKNKKNNNIYKQEIEPYSLNYEKNREGKLQIEYIENIQYEKKGYDTTRLIVDSRNGNISECRISWYGKDDAMILDQKTGEMLGRATNYKDILVEIDYNLLQKDPNYANSLMLLLLNKDRVNGYLERGMQANPEVLCGKYVGGIRKNEEGQYEKVFDTNIGVMSHNSLEMLNKRKKEKERKVQNLRDRLKVENDVAVDALNKAKEIQKQIDDAEKMR